MANEIRPGLDAAAGEAGRADPVSAAASEELTRRVRRASTLLGLGENADAAEIYARIAKEYPQDYRGWWGLICCSERAEALPSDLQGQLDHWFGYVRQYAPAAEYPAVERQYLEFKHRAAEAAVPAEISRVRSRIAALRAEVSKAEGQKSFLLGEVSKQQDAYSLVSGADDLKIEQLVKEKKTNERRMSAFRTLRIMGACLTALSLVLLIILLTSKSGSALEYVVSCVCIVVGLLGAFDVFNRPRREAPLLAMRINAAKTEKADHERKVRLEIKTLNDMAAKVSDEQIPAIRAKIDGCNAYLNLGSERLADGLYTGLCREIGIEIPPNEETQRLHGFTVADPPADASAAAEPAEE